MQSHPKELLDHNSKLIHSEALKVTSHVQRDDGEWILHTLMIDGYDVPFRFRRPDKYKSLKGARVNLTYYPAQEMLVGIPIEVMKVVRVKRT